uniref:Uncharacterized protein n=1 Tax=Ralstonia solanacearum TaxID=305 RepID=A0A0S4WZG7_RALSL|nr:protein of unknown function [Ralstonia solanacearum]
MPVGFTQWGEPHSLRARIEGASLGKLTESLPLAPKSTGNIDERRERKSDQQDGGQRARLAGHA